MAEERARRRRPPRFSGVIVHRDRLGRYSIRYPTDWELFVHDGSGEGEQDGGTFRPSPDDPRTFLNLWVRELDRSIVAEDLDDLRDGVREGLKQLREVSIESLVEIPLEGSNLLKLEAVYTFREDEATLKRKTWVIFADRWQYVVTWQGSSPAEYGHWLAMANYSFATFELPQALMLATDRETIARSAEALEDEGG